MNKCESALLLRNTALKVPAVNFTEFFLSSELEICQIVMKQFGWSANRDVFWIA